MTGDPGAAARRLRREAVPASVPVVPASRPQGPGIVHLGLGNFHRAHQAVYTAAAAPDGEWGIVGVASRSADVVRALREQESAYTVLTLAGDTVEAQVVDVHSELLVGADDPGRVTGWIADPGTSVVTLTVTEHGYTYTAERRLDVDNAAVRDDLAGHTAPRTPIGQLATGLLHRFRTSGEPLNVVCCDNLTENGELTSRLVVEFLTCSSAARDDGLMEWLASRVAFPNTAVDRIVPRTTDLHRRLARVATGLDDQVPVPAEPFSMWVLQNRFTAARPAWETVGAILTDDVAPYELAKLRLLNGTHSLIAYLGMLSGYRTIDQAVGDPHIRRAAERLMYVEMRPTLDPVPQLDLDAYCATLFERFGNAATGHLTAQVGSDGSGKVPMRITEPVAFHTSRGTAPTAIALLAAAFVRCLAVPGACAAEIIAPLRDPALDRLRKLGASLSDPGALTRQVLRSSGIFAESLQQNEEFLGLAADAAAALAEGGVSEGVARLDG